MTEALVTAVEDDARSLAESLKAAQEAGVGPAILLPALISVFREAGIFGAGELPFPLPSFQ